MSLPWSNADRYTDFLVNEILPSGHVVHLDNTQAPKKKKETNNGSKPSGPSHPAPKDHQEIVRNVGTLAKEDANSAPSDAKITTGTAASQPSSPTVKPGDEIGHDAAINTVASTDRTSTSTIPASMQGFDSLPTKPEKLAPHMRTAPPSSPVPLSMRDLDDAGVTPKPARKKETVRIRRTSQGWIEVDEGKEKELNDAKATEDRLVNQKTEDAAIRAEAAAVDTQPGDAAIQEAVKQESEIREEAKEPPQPSTRVSWQAFAGATSADAEAATGFKVSCSTDSNLPQGH